MKRSDFWFDLPDDRIAQTPIEPRDHARLMSVNRRTGEIGEGHFYDLPKLLHPGDLLVVNDSRVLPARLYGVKDTGAKIEVLLLEEKGEGRWEVMVHPGRRMKIGAKVTFGDGLLDCEVLDVLPGGNRLVEFHCEGNFYATLDRIGQMPLPHYITAKLEDQERYQTVYNRERGSAAAPTAGLHFTLELMDKLRAMGVAFAPITLHIGLGTFRPVKVEEITDHKMHTEHFTLPQSTADAINRTKAAGGRVIGVGTTSCRTLESVASRLGSIQAYEGDTDIFIYPGYQFQVLDGLITNFHLPESTLIMLVSAFAGRELILKAYEQAIRDGFRFYSFGDSMYIL